MQHKRVRKPDLIQTIRDEDLTGLYARVSTDFQFEEGYSIDAQKEKLVAYCVSMGYPNYEFYIDGGFSGSNLDRPSIQRLMSASPAMTLF